MLLLGWVAAAHAVQSHATKKLVYINVDETMIAYGYKGTRGTVACKDSWEHINENLIYDAVSIGQTHTNMSWIAAIASDAAVQRALPQVFRASKQKFPLYLLDFAEAIMPQNMEIWLGDSMWNTQEGFLGWLQLLCKSLASFRNRCVFILVGDASKTHINDAIAEFCKAQDILFLLIPGGLTGVLQPLDVYVFAQVKQRLRKRILELRLQDEEGQMTKQQWLSAVRDQVTFLESLDHAHFFQRLGYDGLQQDLRLVKDGVVTQAAVDTNPRRQPSRRELADMLGRTNCPFYNALMHKYPAIAASADSESQASQSGRVVVRV